MKQNEEPRLTWEDLARIESALVGSINKAIIMKEEARERGQKDLSGFDGTISTNKETLEKVKALKSIAFDSEIWGK